MNNLTTLQLLQELSRSCVYKTCEHETEKIPPKLDTFEIKGATFVRGNLLKCSIDGDECNIRIWFNNALNMNDSDGHLELKAYRNMLDEIKWGRLRNQHNANQDDRDHFILVIDEQNRVLDFQRDREMEQYIKAKRAIGIRGRTVWPLD